MGQKVSKNKTNKLKIIAMAILGLFVMIILVRSIKDATNSLKTDKPTAISNTSHTIVSDYETLESLLAGYSCKVLGKKEIDNATEVKLSFAENLYSGEKSNERYFTNICKGVAEILKYKNFKLIDEKRNINIEVKCEKPNIVELKINGDENYYLNRESQISSSKRNRKITSFTIQSVELQNLNNNNWNELNVNFGTKESTCDGYDIYFDEGIKSKTVARNIFNVVFTANYKGKIAGGLNANSNKSDVESALGTPTFDNDNIYGYLGEKNYLFFDFLNKEVSVYPVVSVTQDEETKLKAYIEEMNKTNNVKKFVTDLTGYWLDFDFYKFDSGFVDLRYTLKGFKLDISSNSLKNGIFIYTNYSGNSDIQDMENVYLVSSDFVFDLEKDRSIKERVQRIEEGDFSEEQLKELGIDFSVRFENANIGSYDGVKFYSRDKSYPDSELDKNLEISSYKWYDGSFNYLFIYSINDDGIYVYNCRNMTNLKLVELKGDIKINNAKNEIISYTNDGNKNELKVTLD